MGVMDIIMNVKKYKVISIMDGTRHGDIRIV